MSLIRFANFRHVNKHVLQITYESTVKRFVADIVNGSFVFNMSQLKGQITHLFNLPIDSELELSYIDEHWDLITMTNDEDLEDIMTQMTLPLLRMYVKVINNAPTKQVGEEGAAGLKHTSASNFTNTFESDALAKSDEDGWYSIN